MERLKLDLQKKENDLLHVHADGLHSVEDMEELHRKCRALTAELSELKKERILNRYPHIRKQMFTYQRSY